MSLRDNFRKLTRAVGKMARLNAYTAFLIFLMVGGMVTSLTLSRGHKDPLMFQEKYFKCQTQQMIWTPCFSTVFCIFFRMISAFIYSHPPLCEQTHWG